MANKRKATQIVPTEVLDEMKRVDTDAVLDKVSILSDILTYVTIDDEKTIFGSEPVYIPIFTKAEQIKIKEKLFGLMERL